MGEVAPVPPLTDFTGGHVVEAQFRLDLQTPKWIAAKILRVWGIRSTGITIRTTGLCCIARNIRENEEMSGRNKER